MSQRSVVPFAKYHGTGNDFLVVDADAPVRNRGAFARRHCDRETGAVVDGRRGADGVLFLDIDDGLTPTRVNMTLVQPDGSTAAMCGNGARCVAAWAHDRTGETEFMIDTQAGTRHATLAGADRSDGDDVEIEMGEPTFDPDRVPVAADAPLVDREVAGLPVTAVDTGVPHAVAVVDDVDAVEFADIAEPVRHADAFPEGANVSVASRVDEAGTDAPVFDQRTFERGVEGETRSCGTGAVAVAAVARRLGLVESETVRTRPPGGELETTVPDDGPATLAGPVVRDGTGELDATPER